MRILAASRVRTLLLHPKLGMAMSGCGLPSAVGRALANLSLQRASVSFCRALARSSGQISAALLPAFTAAFSASLFRCLGAATSVTWTICPPLDT